MGYYFKDSVSALTDDQGEVTDRVDEAWQCVDGRLLSNRLKGEKNGYLIGNSLNQYSPYGIITYREGTTDTPFLYTGFFGNPTDDNGLIHMRARYYNPTIRRFLNQDPAQEAWNWYAYVGGNPLAFVDPSGLGRNSVLDSMETSLSFLGLNTRIEIQTEIRPKHWQAGIKSTHWADIDRYKNKILDSGFTTGKTDLKLFEVGSLRNNFKEKITDYSDSIKVNMIGQTASGVMFMPNINYDITVSIDKQTGEAKLSGAHDGFPSYTISVDGKVIYDHQQTNELDLFGTDDIKVNVP